jgi:hypothetical protein
MVPSQHMEVTMQLVFKSRLVTAQEWAAAEDKVATGLPLCRQKGSTLLLGKGFPRRSKSPRRLLEVKPRRPGQEMTIDGGNAGAIALESVRARVQAKIEESRSPALAEEGSFE